MLHTFLMAAAVFVASAMGNDEPQPAGKGRGGSEADTVASLSYWSHGKRRVLTLVRSDLPPLFSDPLSRLSEMRKRPDLGQFGFGTPFTLFDAPADAPAKAIPVWVGYVDDHLNERDSWNVFACLAWDAQRKESLITFVENYRQGIAATVTVFRTAVTTPISDSSPTFSADEIATWPAPHGFIGRVTVDLPIAAGRPSEVTWTTVLSEDTRVDVALSLNNRSLTPFIVRFHTENKQWAKVVQTEESLPERTK